MGHWVGNFNRFDSSDCAFNLEVIVGLLRHLDGNGVGQSSGNFDSFETSTVCALIREGNTGLLRLLGRKGVGQ